MIKLSDRLQLLANQIRKGETMADIGTDHGFLPLYLIEQGISPSVILADISAGSLDKARKNIAEIYGSDASAFCLRLGDGIKVIGNGEVSNVVIAGMGGILMTEILGSDIEKTKSLGKLILQPRNKPGILYHWLHINGFEVEKELLVREGRYICEILVAYPSDNPDDGLYGQYCGALCEADELIPYEYETPARLFKDNAREIAEAYVRRKLSTEEKIEAAILSGEKCEERRLFETRKRVEYLKQLLQDNVEIRMA